MRCLPIHLLLVEFSWLLLIGTSVCVPNCHDAMNEILDLQRDLHAIDFAVCEEQTFSGVESFYLLILFLSGRVAHRSMLVVSRHLLFDTATFCVGVLAVEMRIRVTHGIAGSTGTSSCFLTF